MKIQNILWQVNGVLFDTYPALTYSFSRALNEMGYSVALNVIDGLVRQSLDDCVNALSGRFRLDPDLLRQRYV
jgi:phosphoglycolate phosphatase-like HAD superfamily hydrolase